MIEVFDVLALLVSGNARAMAEGVSRATIPTMAGMVAALWPLLGSSTYASLIVLRQSFLRLGSSMRKNYGYEETDDDINMTPMLDIVFIMLISSLLQLFMRGLASTFSALGGDIE